LLAHAFERFGVVEAVERIVLEDAGDIDQHVDPALTETPCGFGQGRARGDLDALDDLRADLLEARLAVAASDSNSRACSASAATR
jgi:hypothetical protein